MLHSMKPLLLAAAFALTATTLLASADLSLVVATPIVPIHAGDSIGIQLSVRIPSFPAPLARVSCAFIVVDVLL